MEVSKYQKAASAAMKLNLIRAKHQRKLDRLAKAGNKHDEYATTDGQIRALDFAIATLEELAGKGCNYTEGGRRCMLGRDHRAEVAHVLGGES